MKASRAAIKTANAVVGTVERLDRIEHALKVILTILERPEEAVKLVSPILPKVEEVPAAAPTPLLRKKSK